MSAVSLVTTPEASPATAKPGRGNLRPPWPKGFCPNPGGKGSRYHEVQALARDSAPEAMRTLIALLDDPDPRIRTVASNSILDRAFGKPKEMQPEEKRERTTVDLSKLSDEQKRLLLEMFRSGVLKARGE